MPVLQQTGATVASSSFPGLQVYGGDIISAALRSIGAIVPGEKPKPAEMQDALITLNQMIDSWQAQRLMVYAIVRYIYAPTVLKQTYTVGPGGDIMFRQAKAVPIQFFKDGLPALEQKLWDSPWGKIGICICYDLSYTRVTDRLVQLGAEALIVPTMDVADWGRAQHELHARIAPVRAAEYGLPIFRLASSGISQLIGWAGGVMATAPCPGVGAMLAGTLEMRGGGKRPLDRWLAPFATAMTAALIVWFSVWRRPGDFPPAGSKVQEA